MLATARHDDDMAASSLRGMAGVAIFGTLHIAARPAARANVATAS